MEQFYQSTNTLDHVIWYFNRSDELQQSTSDLLSMAFRARLDQVFQLSQCGIHRSVRSYSNKHKARECEGGGESYGV